MSSRKAITVPRAALPRGRCHLLIARDFEPVSTGITPPLSLLPAHAPDLNPLASFGPSKGSLVPRVFAGGYVPLLGVGPSRRYLHNLCVGAWTLTPRRLFGALTRLFPKNIGLTLDLRGSARSDTRQYTTLMAHAFRGCSQFVMFRLPHLLDPPVVPTARISSRAAGPFTPRNELGVTPKNCGIATCLNRAIGTAGLPPARLWPCRPLPRSPRAELPHGAPQSYSLRTVGDNVIALLRSRGICVVSGG